MKNYMMLVTSDINGDSVMDENDQYGYTAHPKMTAPGFWIGADELSVVKDENDHPVINMTDQHFVEVFDKIFNVVWDSNASYLTAGDNLDIPTECRKVFSENRSLFIDMSFFYIEASVASRPISVSYRIRNMTRISRSITRESATTSRPWFRQPVRIPTLSDICSKR